ncbi:MAG: hypothetical protein KGJ48_10285, partial [Nitrospirota bacterium]|nr:hypothetical protein [Nitrospirota bacterium]
ANSPDPSLNPLQLKKWKGEDHGNLMQYFYIVRAAKEKHKRKGQAAGSYGDFHCPYCLAEQYWFTHSVYRNRYRG